MIIPHRRECLVRVDFISSSPQITSVTQKDVVLNDNNAIISIDYANIVIYEDVGPNRRQIEVTILATELAQVAPTCSGLQSSAMNEFGAQAIASLGGYGVQRAQKHQHRDVLLWQARCGPLQV
jgi:hypothetical protein